MFKSIFKKLEFKFNRKDTAKIKNMKKLLLVITALISTIAFGQNHFIGHTTITFQDPDRGNRSIETEIYYPATTAGDNVSAINEKFPVIVFGHGFVMAWSAYKNLWEEFVPKGYIMVFPRTEGNILSTDHQKFGWDLQFLVTEMQNLGNNSSSLLYNCIAPETALMGHSMGGGAAFLAADSLCVNGNTNLKTLIGLAPAESSTNGVSSIASATKITVPSLILSGVQDGVTPPNEHHIPMYNSLASDCKSIINVTGGAHCYFANSNTACDFGEGTSSSGISITRTEQHEITFDYVNLWLDYTLKGNCFAFDIFNDSLVNATRVTYDQVCGTPSAIEVFNTVDICDGDSYTFPDGTVGSSSMVNTSNLTTQKGCDSIIETTLTVLLPIETYESKSICQGDSYTFPDGTIGNSSGTHISTLTASNGCDSIVETYLSVTTIDTTVINNSNELTAVQNNANYQWINCSDMSNISNETNISYTPSSSGTYAVEITINGRSSTSSCHKTELLGINHESGNSLFKLYPNPSNGIINIENNKGKTVLIYDSKLSLVYTSSLKIGKQVLDTNLSSGIYIWKAIESNGEIKSGKLIIN